MPDWCTSAKDEDEAVLVPALELLQTPGGVAEEKLYKTARAALSALGVTYGPSQVRYIPGIHIVKRAEGALGHVGAASRNDGDR